MIKFNCSNFGYAENIWREENNISVQGSNLSISNKML